GPEELRRPHRRAALVALDRERGRDRRIALGTAVAQLASAVGALRGKVGLVVEEVPLREAAAKAERHPVAERLPSLLLDPVALRRSHATHCSPQPASLR